MFFYTLFFIKVIASVFGSIALVMYGISILYFLLLGLSKVTLLTENILNFSGRLAKRKFLELRNLYF